MGFLPNGYKEPSSGNNRYLRLQKDETVKIRILGSFEDSTGIMGYQGWVTDDEGNRKPIRSIEDEKGTLQGKCDPGEKVKFFWALPVYHYEDETLKVWEITQKTIRDQISALAGDEDFGNPNHYDIKVSRTGDGFDTAYNIKPLPKSEFSKEVQNVIDTELIHIKMKELFTGGDPFDGMPF
jgi:hypothetical protein